MYPVTEDFIQKMKADRRRVLARVEVDYTDPFLDQSLEIEANEQANVSYPQQTADSVDQTTRKYACLDGTWDLTTGEYHLAPSMSQPTTEQFGWWGAQFANPGALVFDGVDDYVELSQALNIFNSSFTIEIGVFHTAASRAILLGDYGLPGAINVNFEITTDNKLRLYWAGTPDLRGVKTVPVGQWCNVAFVRDKVNNRVRFYIDGNLDLDHNGALSDKVAVVPHRIGMDNRTGETAFEGCMKYIRIWNRALSQGEIRTYQHKELMGNEPGLIAYYKFDEGSGVTLHDHVQSNDGMIYGPTWIKKGSFASPYPTLTVRHLPRPIRQLKVVGDIAREEWPVDFQIKLYGPDDTLLKTETVTGNDQISWSKTLDPQVLDVAKQELIITRWSLPGTCAKIIEFFTSIREVYETGDLVSLRLLEEREASQGSLPVGNISSNEITLALNNADKKFDLDNENSPLKNLLKPNRRIQAWLGAEAENAAAENPPTFTRNSIAYLSNGTQVAANVPRFEQGKFGKAVLVEEGTENLLANPFFALDSDGDGLADGWLKAYNLDGAAWTRENIAGWSGKAQKAYIVDADYSDSELGIRQRDINKPGETVTLHARGITNKATVRLQAYDMSNAVVIASRNFEVTPGVEFDISLTFTIPVNCTNLQIYILTTRVAGWAVGDYISVYAAQLEAKPYPTSFIDGTRAAETLEVPTEGVLNPQEGTVECWINLHAWVNGISDNGVWSLTGSTRLDMWFAKSNSNCLGVYDGTAWLNSGVASSSFVDSWHYIAYTWGSFGQKIYVDGVLKASTTRLISSAHISSLLYIGSFRGRYQTNSLIDDIRISSRARTDEEILAAYQSNKPLQRDEDTTYLLSFNGSIYPVEMCWVPLGTFWSLDWDSPDDTLEATVTARDRMELLRKGTYQTSQVQQDKSLYELAEIVLQDAGLTDDEYVIDEALKDIVVPYAWFGPISHREALRRIAEAGLAVAFQNRDGKIQIESFLITGDEPVMEITEDDYFPPLRAPSRQQDVANEIVVDTQPLRPVTTPEEVYRSNEPITIPANTTKTITAFYNKTPVIGAIATLDSPPAGVAITESTYYGWGASIKIANSTGTDQQVTLVIQGKPLTVQGKERVIVRDEASITENGVLTFEFPANPLVQTLAQAQAIANTLLASVKDPRRDIEVDWRGNPALELGDRVTVKGKDYHVIRQEISWQGYLSARLTGRRAT